LLTEASGLYLLGMSCDTILHS